MLDRLARWAPVTGILVVPLVVVGFALSADTPSQHASDQKWVSYFTDHGTQTQAFVSFFLVAIGAICLLWFAGTLRAVLVGAEGQPGRLSALAYGGGIVMAAMLLSTALALVWLPAVKNFHGDEFKVDPDTARLIADLPFFTMILASFAGTVLVGAASLVALRTGVFARWLAWAGVAVAILLLLAFPLYLVPLGLFFLWLIVTSGLLLRRSMSGVEARQPTTAPA